MVSSLSAIPFDTNYIEFYIINKHTLLDDGIDVIDINLDRDVFMKILGNMKLLASSDVKYFQKTYKEYMVSDITCQVHSHIEDIKVFRKKALGFVKEEKHPNVKVIFSTKSKLTMLNFPSTTNIQEMSYVKTLIFRVNNRIYVNFNVSISADDPESKTYTIFINYNHDNNVDITLTQNILQNLLDTILQI